MTTVDHAPRWGTIAQAAEALKVSRDTVRRMISRNEIPANRIGPKLIRVDLNAVDRLGKPVAA